MSATIDANILVYASNQADPVHAQAGRLLQVLAAGPDLLYLFWPVVLGYLRTVSQQHYDTMWIVTTRCRLDCRSGADRAGYQDHND